MNSLRNIAAAAGRLAAVSILTMGATVRGQEVAEIPFTHAPEGTAALGGGLRFGQSPYRASDNSELRTTDLIPLYLYEGKYFFVHGTAGGIHVIKRDAFRFDLYTRYRFQKLDPASNAYYAGLEKREQSLDTGLQMSLNQKWGGLKLTWLAGALNRHNGQEVELAYRYRYDAGPWSISPYISWSWQNDNLTNYYFGVSEAEARPDRPAFVPGESEWVSVGLNTSWHATDRIVFFANFGFSGTDSEVVNSPLVDKPRFSTAFVGGTYIFGNARRPDYIMDKERVGEWSWRVNYGYQAEGNIVSEIDQGDFSKSTVADANLGGLTFGKLLTAGPRIDFVGKLALFRHFEADEGNGNFYSYAAYIMARGKGHSPWSKEELFRWGFGFGMSYAETVPIAEQRKQAAKGNNTSRFLNYLEMTLDFPLKRVSKANWLQRCYAGLTLVHRSGIFGTSDLLGDVSGGADWITAHLECTQ
ncbi:MAG: MipA/OmpV family protein [Gammaproteobacteria bacterium]|nr:MipA/OmpV family protein [Gammaproteobacteria bacterium]MDH4314095.1 MipA/OmpV family protein [Gammaproteobacteria bacterium]MDH5213138.1 MipA/OmpV family protein [Gammaproteobacteria bacterium]MDH5502087.1 MipA/OmpV family protein [Gammaproteobacteria bacterium]